MSKRALSEVLLKMVGLYWFLLACSQLLSILGARYLYENPKTDVLLGIIIPHIAFSLIYGLGSFMLLRKTQLFLRIMNISDNDPQSPINANVQEIEVFGFALVGVYLFVDGTSCLASGIAWYFDQRAFNSSYHQSVELRTFLPEVLRGIVSIVLSLFLFFGRRTLYRVWAASRPLAKQISELRGKDINEEAS